MRLLTFLWLNKYIKKHKLKHKEITTAMESFVKYQRKIHNYVEQVFKQPIPFKTRHYIPSEL